VWGHGSGEGSDVKFAAGTICRLVETIQRHRVGLFIDAPCGDQQWAYILRGILPHLDYIGVDVVPGLIMRNKELFADQRTEFFLLDLSDTAAFEMIQEHSKLWQKMAAPKQPLEYSHVAIMSRHVLEHNPNQNIFKILNNIRSSAADYFIGTWQPWAAQNRDLAVPGGYRALDFTRAPFNLPHPKLAWIENELEKSDMLNPQPFMAMWIRSDIPQFDMELGSMS
jgi:hypothetical protein